MRHALSSAAVLLALLTGSLVHASQIYRTVDEDGNVVFTDIPPKEDSEGEQVVVETPNSFSVDEALPEGGSWIVEDDEASAGTESFTYATLQVTSPPDDEAIRDNAGNVTIIANVNPRLQPGHRMRLYLDGQLIQEGEQSTFELANVDRGTHEVELEIVDESGRTLMRSPRSTFHLLRYHLPPGPRTGG